MSEGSNKLAQSRLAIIEHIQRKERRQDGHEGVRQNGAQAHEFSDDGQTDESDSWFANIRQATRTWWRHHPAHMAVELATPALSAYARRRPVQFLAFAVGVGALAVVARPWKLISVTGLLVALVKSSQLSTLVMSAMSAADYQKDSQKDSPPPP
jgi:hypothetical protein